MKKIIISATVFSLLLAACSSNTGQQTTKQAGKETHEEHSKHEEAEKIVLNHGEKWKVDAHMMEHIRTMDNQINTVAKSETKDFKALSKSLQGSIDLLTSNCTMEGQAHDELHKWLLPYIDMVNELSETTNQEKAAEQFAQIQQSFKTFHQYFQ